MNKDELQNILMQIGIMRIESFQIEYIDYMDEKKIKKIEFKA